MNKHLTLILLMSIAAITANAQTQQQADSLYQIGRAVFDVVGTLKEGNLSSSLRLRYLHTWKQELGTEDNELRTRLIVSYKIPETPTSKSYKALIFSEGPACVYDKGTLYFML